VQDQQNIEELFRESFQNFEEPVKPELWNQIADKIGASAPAPGAESPVHVVETVATGSKVTGTIATWISVAAITISGIVGYYVYNSFQSTTAPAENHQSVLQENSTSQDLSTLENTASSATAETTNNKPVASENGIEKSGSTTSDKSTTSLNNDKGHSVVQSGILSVESAEENSAPSANKSEDQNKFTQGTQTPNSNTPSASKDSEIQIPTPNVQPSIGYAPLEVSFSLSGDVQKAEWDFGSGVVESKTVPFSHIFDKTGIHTITVKTTDIKGNIKSEVINIEVIEDLNIKGISNVFTPNYDGSNDRFTFDGGNLADIEVTIYDKGGKLIYKFTDPQLGWDGKYSSGNDVPEGTYFYVIFATGFGQKKHQQGGTVTIIR